VRAISKEKVALSLKIKRAYARFYPSRFSSFYGVGRDYSFSIRTAATGYQKLYLELMKKPLSSGFFLVYFCRMKLHRLLFILLISAAFLNACSNGNASGDVIVLFQPKYAKGFRVVKTGNDTLIQFLTHSDSPAVSHSVSLSKINPERIALLSTTHSYFVNTLDGIKNVCGVTYADRIQLENLQAQIANGKTQNLTTNGNVNMEELLLLNPTVLFSVPFEPTQYQTKLPNCSVIPTAEYLEEHPLGKAEWIYVFGYVLRKDVLSNELFLKIEREYLDSAEDSSQLRSRKVFFATNNGSDWTVANNQSYWAILLKDAGAAYVGAMNDKGNLNFDKERMLFALNEADAYGELVYFPNTPYVSLSQLHPEFAQSGPFQHKKIFFCNAADNGFFDKALLEPHILLQELRMVLSDSTFSGNYFQRTQ
jgi:iron complex transport system substrate-binding protein